MYQLPMECVARTIWFLMLNDVARLSCVCRMFSPPLASANATIFTYSIVTSRDTVNETPLSQSLSRCRQRLLQEHRHGRLNELEA